MIFRLPHARAHHVSRKEYPHALACLVHRSRHGNYLGPEPQMGSHDLPSPCCRPHPHCLSFLNMGLLSYAMRFLPAGLSYALWTGLGSIGVAVGGMLFFQDRISLPQAGFMLLILVGCIGARLGAPQD